MAEDTISGILSKNKQSNDNSIEAFKRDLQKLRTGRASAGLIENIVVDYYGSKTPLMHLGQISTPEPRMIVIQVYDAGAISSVEKALQQSELGLNPSRDGNSIRVMITPLTEESRKDIVKILNKNAEEMRVSIRNHRRDANDSLKRLEKDSAITQDESKKAQETTQNQTNQFIKKIDELLAEKEAEILEV